ncbi:MAG: TolC family protein [Prevotella sp.]|nr:TolC family protein [Prevotella sp.]
MKNSLNILLLAAGLSFVSLHAGAQKIMTIEECIEAARKGNIWAKNAQNDILMAKEQKKFIHSKYYPMVSASFTHFEASKSLINYQIFDKETIDNFNAEMESDFTVGDFTLSFVKKASSAGLTFIEPVYTGGRLTNFNKLADLQVNARNMMSEVTDDQIVMGTEFLYYKIWELHETDKSLDAMEKELNFIHQDAFNYYDNGIVNKNDVLSVELMLDQLSALRIRANNDCRLLRRALAKFMGMADEDIDVDTTLNTEVIDPQQLRVDSHRAMEGRTETQLLDIWVEKAALEKKIAKANMLPIVAVGGRYGYSKVLNGWEPRAIAFVGVQMPLSYFWSEKHEYKRKEIEMQKAIDMRQDNRETMTLQIQDAYDNLESTYKQVQIAEKSIVRAEENLRISRENYKQGMSTMTSLLDAQRQQQQALVQKNTALSEYLQAKTRYLIATGRRTY